MTRLCRWTAAAAALLLTLSLVRHPPTQLRSVASPASTYDDAASVTDVGAAFLRAALSKSRDIDWTAWATPRLATTLDDYPEPRHPGRPLSALSVVLLSIEDGTARVAAEARFMLSERTIVVAYVLELLATPHGWRVEGVAS